ncbi:hypothetical protein [Diaphorobacter sp. J5-51]|nr:hypothetical protein [Diaphorobacter sp. J5-51]
MLLKLLRHLQQEVKIALRTPTLKQKEAYGRLARGMRDWMRFSGVF